jgi:hypothetical protein
LVWEERRQTKQDKYLAQIATEVRRSYVRHPRRVNVKDFFIVWMDRATNERVEKSKQTWASILGVDLNKN